VTTTSARLTAAGRALLLVTVVSMAGDLGAAGTSPLVDAVKRGDVAAARQLARNKAAVNAAEADGTTALHWAVQSNNLELVTLLVRAGANVKTPNRYGVPPITLAAMNGGAAVVGALLEGGADANTVTTAGEPVLLTAARTGDLATVQTLLKRGAQVNTKEQWFGETAMMWAAAENHADVVKALAAAGGEVNARSTVLDTPVLEFPRSGGPNSPFPRGGWTPLMFAARQGSTEAALALVEAGANINTVALPETDITLKADELTSADRGIGTSALVFAIINAHYDLAVKLLEKGANPNVVDLAGMGALYAAVDMNSMQWIQGHPQPILTDSIDGSELVRILLTKGADPNARLKRNPLKRHHDAGTTLNFGEGTTPLMRAARTNDVAVMKVLLDGGADPFLTLPDRTNTLMIAAGQGYGGIRGEAVRIVVPTPEGAVEAVKLLIDRGMDVDAFNSAGNTAMHGAVGRGDAVVKFLASQGAALNQRNKAGFTPLDLALGLAGGRGGRGVVRESTAALLRQLMKDAGIAETPRSSPARAAGPRPTQQ
jgi:ankyrin repeat protein